MFQGSEHLDKGEMPRLIQGNGGVFNGFTRPDTTVYFEQVPAGALELALYCEADRMRSPRITQENLANQIAVVKEEILVNVENQPYGGFPWLDLPPVMFGTFANAHNGYGSFEDLETASLEHARHFFDAYYAPANAVLSIAGGVDPATALLLAERYFSGVPARPAPARPSFAEPGRSGIAPVERVDQLAPLPALAVGYRVPDPIGDEDSYFATVLLSALLTLGPASRLHERLVRHDRIAADVGAMWSGLDSPWGSRDPAFLAFIAHYPEHALTERVVAAIDEELERVAQGVAQEDVDAVLAQVASAEWMELDTKYWLAVRAGVFAQQRTRPHLAFEIADRLSAAAPLVPEVAGRWFTPDLRAMVTLVPGTPP